MSASQPTYEKSLVWFRRDLRDYDHAALYHALKYSKQVFCVFIFDTVILDHLTDKLDRRVEFIWESIRELKAAFQAKGSDLIVLHGNPRLEIPKLANNLKVEALFANHDYEPSAIQRDTEVAQQLETINIQFHHYKDHVIFEKNEVLTGQNTPYTVFTPYSRKWKEKLANSEWKQFESENLTNYIPASFEIPSLRQLGFEESYLSFPSLIFSDDLIREYQIKRDYPGLDATSHVSVHLRFGTISIRKLVKRALGKSETWLNELIWRDFYFNITFHFPHIGQGLAFRQVHATAVQYTILY